MGSTIFDESSLSEVGKSTTAEFPPTEVKHTGIFIEAGISRAKGSRPNQEDSFCIAGDHLETDGYAIYCVFDGHGCADYAMHASVHMKDYILLDGAFQHGDFESALSRGFRRENEALKQAFENNPKGGTTATVTLVANNRLYLANVGDSRCVLAQLDRNYSLKAIRISKDHKTKDPQEYQRVVSHGGIISGGRVYSQDHAINMTKALGDFDFKAPLNHADGDWIAADPFINSVVLKPQHDFLVLASDGLWNLMKDQQVVETVQKWRKLGFSAQEISQKLANQIISEPESDNVTIILLFFMTKDQASICKSGDISPTPKEKNSL